MDHLSQLVRWFGRGLFVRLGALVALSIVATCAEAAFPQPTNGYQLCQVDNTVYPSPAAACASRNGSTVTYSLVPHANSALSYDGRRSGLGCRRSDNNDIQYSICYAPTSSPVVPPGATCNAGECTCNAGYIEDTLNRTCVQNNCPPDGQIVGDSSMRFNAPGTGSAVCINGCIYVLEWMYGSGANRWGRGPMHSLGAPCTGQPGGGGAPATENTPHRCQPGTCPGQINGTQVCVPCSTSNNDVSPPSPNASAPGGSGTTTTTTVNPDGTITTTTTGRDGTSSSQPGPGNQIGLEGYCLRNPTAFICTGRVEFPSSSASAPQPGASAPESSFSGGCGSFSCSGDAVTCAMAREQHQRNCQMFDQPTELSNAGVAATSAGDRPAGHPYNAAESSALDLSSRINQAPLVGSTTGCPSNVSVSSPVGELTIPFASLCQYLPTLRAIVLAFAMLTAGFIVFGVRGPS